MLITTRLVKLKEILLDIKAHFALVLAQNINQFEIANIAIDSRLVELGSIFFAMKGIKTDGNQFIESAIDKGAICIISSELDRLSEVKLLASQRSIVLIYSQEINQFLLEIISKFYHPLPSNIYAVTGTNGKTSVAEFTRQIFQLIGKRSASIGTLGVNLEIDGKKIAQEHFQNPDLTTPDIVSLYKNLYLLKEKFAVDDVAIEASSIGLEQGRMAGLPIAVRSFTNFTQDHLDYHGEMEEYFRCKMMLFENKSHKEAFAILNSDISEFGRINKIAAENGLKIFDYGFAAKNFRLLKTLQKGAIFSFCGHEYEFKLSLLGDFQIMNVLCALAGILAINPLSNQEIKALLQQFSKLKSASGRMELIANFNDALIFVDFAHSPDALSNSLQYARKITKGRLVVLFGCGGNRDNEKRPIMGKIASDLADLVIVTDDNPRHENPSLIRSQIMKGVDLSKAIEVKDRMEAIKSAIEGLCPNDILIIAGKGHEKYQIIGDKKIDFDEEKIVHQIIMEN